jgi:hypothetical protein
MYFIVVKDKNNVGELNFNIFRLFWCIDIKNKYILKYNVTTIPWPFDDTFLAKILFHANDH